MRLPIYFTLLILTQQGAMRKRTILLEKQEGECLFQRKNSVQAYIHTCERDSFVNEIVIQHLEKYYFAAASFSCKLSNAGFFCHRSYFPHSCRKSPFKRQSVSVCGVCVRGGGGLGDNLHLVFTDRSQFLESGFQVGFGK